MFGFAPGSVATGSRGIGETYRFRVDGHFTTLAWIQGIAVREAIEGHRETMTKLKSARHHWWPKCVSRYWADINGLANRLSPDGQVRSARPESFGAIGNGHHIKLSRDERGTSV